eukprot:TRINITY_DN12367_c0_g1_i1.p1 TRINITY_DN12367_c0_g1~~TRINITY_DN12367_c0_g1_i1.p1  ORF type:complete len:308 (-),score=66.08 TRINITY_DN12367_c0_g1_i1:9-851(-)
MIKGEIPSYRDERGGYFIDRDGYLFSPLLDYLRSGILTIPSSVSYLRVVEEARFYGIDLSDAFLCDVQEGLYVSHAYRHIGQNILFIERNPRKPWEFIITGVLEHSGKSGIFVEYWKKLCEVREGSIVIDSEFTISQEEEETLVVTQTSTFNEDVALHFICAKNDQDIPVEYSDSWWLGSRLVNQKSLNICPVKLSEGKDEWVVSISYDNNMLGPLDVTVLCSKLIIVDGKYDSFWIFFPEKEKMVCYKPFYVEKKAKGERIEFSTVKAWFRFRKENSFT